MSMRERYQEKVDAQLNEWKRWVDRYKNDPQLSASDRNADHQQMIARLDDYYKKTQTRLAELRTAPDQRWELAKQAVERAMIDLKQLLDESGAANVGRSLPIQANRPLGPYPK